MELRPCHPVIQPILTNLQPNQVSPSFAAQTRRGAICGNSPFWPAPSMTLMTLGRPEPVLPDIDKERMLEVDNMTLASFKPFQRNGHPPTSSPEQSHPQSPFTPPIYGRRKTLDPIHITGDRSGLNHPASPSASLLEDRRQSAPSPRHAIPRRGSGDTGYAMSRRNSRDAGHPYLRRGSGDTGAEALVVPMRLCRSSDPLKLPSGTEIWWPVHTNCEIKVHVFIASAWPATSERLTRCFNLLQLQASKSTSSRTLNPRTNISCLTPGTVLPVPGDNPTPEIAHGRRFSTASALSLVSNGSPISVCRASQNEFSAERISTFVPSQLRIL